MVSFLRKVLVTAVLVGGLCHSPALVYSESLNNCADIKQTISIEVKALYAEIAKLEQRLDRLQRQGNSMAVQVAIAQIRNQITRLIKRAAELVHDQLFGCQVLPGEDLPPPQQMPEPLPGRSVLVLETII